MLDEEIKAVAAELAVARAGKPARPGADRKRILYSPEGIQRAVRLFHRSGQVPSVFAQRIGVSASALTRWIADEGDGATFVPVRVAGERGARGASTSVVVAAAPDRSASSAPAAQAATSAATVVVRETVISLPADLDLGRVREIMAALRGGAPC